MARIAEDLQLKPAPHLNDHHQGRGKNRARQKAVDIHVADGDGGEGQQEGETRHHLGLIPESMRHHGRRHDQQQNQVKSLGIDDARRLHMVHRVGGEIEQRPPAADPGAGQDAVGFALLKQEAGAQATPRPPRTPPGFSPPVPVVFN